jgi:YggT family protein
MQAASSSNPFLSLICIALTVFWILLFARVILSWVVAMGGRPPVTGPFRTIVELLHDVTEPVIAPLRKIVPPAGMFDISVMIAFVIILVLRTAIC